MRKTTTLLFAVPLAFASVQALAQEQHTEWEPATAEKDKAEPRLVARTHNNNTEANNVVWSEDFGNDIPSTWINQGYTVVGGTKVPNASAVWEYRGPNSNPDNTQGSRGLYAGSGPTITCLTKSNGFIIFDSDYWDTGGSNGSRGNGPAPGPHYGTLTTDTIDLSAHNDVLLSLYSRARNQRSLFKVAFSNDGGLTFPDTFDVHPGLASNSTANSGSEITYNMSAVAGGEPYVVLQFLFDGNGGDGTNGGLYYWQLDDIEIRAVPKHSLKFVTYGDAPANDIIYPANTPVYGNPQIDQAEPIIFDSNVLNFGTEDQTNVRLRVDIKDSTGAIVNTFTSPTLPLLASGDTATYNDFTTTSAWTPSTLGEFYTVFTVESDSVPMVAAAPKDSFRISVNPQRYGAHFGTFSNDIGTDQSRAAIAQVFTFPNSHFDSTGYVLFDAVRVYVSSASDPGGELYVELFDTTGFTYGSSGGPIGAAYANGSYVLDPTDPGNWISIDMTNNGQPLVLPSNKAYMAVVNLYPDPASATLQIGNDQTAGIQPSGMAAMQRDDGNWYRYYTNSLTMATPMIEMVVSAPDSIGLNELVINNALKLYPQPAINKQVNIEVPASGSFQLQVISLNGQLLLEDKVDINHNETLLYNFSKLPKGDFILRLSDKEYQFVQKLKL